MLQPELTLDFKPGDLLWDGLKWHTVERVNYEYHVVLTDTEVVSLWEALSWHAKRDNICIRNPWSKP